MTLVFSIKITSCYKLLTNRCLNIFVVLIKEYLRVHTIDHYTSLKMLSYFIQL